MVEIPHAAELIRKRIVDEPFNPQSPEDLRKALDKARMLFGREPGTRKKKIMYSDDQIQRLFDENHNKVRTFHRVRYDGQSRTTLETGLKTFRGMMYYTPESGPKEYLVQYAGFIPEEQGTVTELLDPDHLPPKFYRKKDSSTSGKLLTDGSVDPTVALYAELHRQLGVSPRDVRMIRKPETKYEENVSFYFHKLRTRFDNITFFLEMLASGYKPQYVQKTGPAEMQVGASKIPVTVSQWVPASSV